MDFVNQISISGIVDQASKGVMRMCVRWDGEEGYLTVLYPQNGQQFDSHLGKSVLVVGKMGLMPGETGPRVVIRAREAHLSS